VYQPYQRRPGICLRENGKIIRTTPIEFDKSDAELWTIDARGKKFTPPRKGLVRNHTLAMKSSAVRERHPGCQRSG
jgi:hypothetical protein